jgi:serine/threonine-protein phosphatase 2B catalytic subunit
MNRIRQKILAVGRISRVFAVLRQESESVSELKDLMGTTKLPYGSLALGAEGLRRAIHNFDDAKRSDIENERLPPTKEEKTKEEKDKINKAIEAAKHTPQKELEEIEAMKMDEVRRDSLALDSPRDV